MNLISLPADHNVIPLSGLRDGEIQHILELGCRLICDGYASGVHQSHDEDGYKYLSVFTSYGEPLSITREYGVYYLLDVKRDVMCSSRRLGKVVDMLVEFL